MTTRSNSPYTPSFLKSSAVDSKPIQLSYSDFNLSDSVAGDSGSFKYDPLGYPLKSTQQLNVDWSKFENHTFFSSAEVRVNEAFNKIINSYPFDGSKKEVEFFLDSLTGFEKWVFDRFPRWAGALHFSGTQVGETPSSTRGNWIAVKDKSGNLYPELAKNNRGTTVINPGDDDSFTIETLVFLPETTNDTQVVFQKSSSPDKSITFYLEPSASTEKTNAVFSVSSGSHRNSVTGILYKGIYNHICLTLNKEDVKENSLQFYLNEDLFAESDKKVRIKKIDADDADFLIGSGSSFYSGDVLVTPTQTFSGSLDELRVFHSVRDRKTQILYSSRGLYAHPDLKLYYRFNEPSGSLSLNGSTNIESLVLDSSGNSLHSNINNYSSDRRVNVSGSIDNVMVNEKDEFKIVLFPAYKDIVDLNVDLLTSASNYDRANPNNILRLIPQHYLLEGASQDGFAEVEGNGGDPYGGEGIPGQGQKGSVQIILTFLYIWAKFFDEIKTYIDSFATLRTVRYDLDDTVPDNFLEDIIREYGFFLPKFFSNASLAQFLDGQHFGSLNDINVTLKSIQTTMIRRVLVNMPSIIKSKGTQHSIRTFLRSVGIDPDNSLRIREYGGPTVKQLSSSREKRIESLAMVDLSGSNLVLSMPLSASRIEPGYPEPAGVFYKDADGNNVGTSRISDGLLTSGSWHLEGLFKIPPQKSSLIADPDGNQSLMRLFITGSAAGAKPGLILNVVASQFAEYPKVSSKVKAFIRPGFSGASPLLELSVDLEDKGIFDGDKWNVAVGCFRNDEIGSFVSSSYYLRVAKNDSGELGTSYVTSSYFYEQVASEGNAFRSGSTDYNVSGSYIAIGSNQTIPTGIPSSGYYFLNDSLNIDDIARTVDYSGWVSNLRFWSKGLDVDEWKEHVRNPKSFGVSDPLVNYNFVDKVSGSFQKLRLDTLQKQSAKNADGSGALELLDFSQNNKHATVTGYLSGSNVFMGDMFSYSYISPMFDEACTDDKIRVRSFQDASLVAENPWAVDAPSYLSNDMFLQEEPQDDLRLSIEFSMMDSLDKDIISMFSSLDTLNNVLGSPELLYSPDYPDLDNLRDVYFNRLSDKPDFRKFLEFYRWFDFSISSFVEQLVPSKTLYKGTNFVVESHMLERHKSLYRYEKIDSSLVEQFEGKLNKF
jgi:hypothetical protein